MSDNRPGSRHPEGPAGVSFTGPKPIASHRCEEHEDPGSGPGLGRDDPLWPQYVKEAEEWDDIMMKDWNRFLVQTSQNLQPNTSEITARVLIEISGTLQSIANGEGVRQNSTTSLRSLDDFNPTTGAFLVNMLWFISLSLSIIVALVASLVKQWCNSFQSDRTAPPCNQARIRQARLNKLISWRTKLIVSALPVIMHVALGLFLSGLVVYLRDLNRPIYFTVISITTAAFLFYIGTTVIPFFIPFCPYETPLSSLKVWGYCYQSWCAIGVYAYGMFVEQTTDPDFTNHISPCEQKELAISNNTSPDDLTGHALNWIITHSQNSPTRAMAIRAISGLKSEGTLLQLVADSPGILPQVIQSFTSCFHVDVSAQKGGDEFKIDKNISVEVVFLHVQALVVLVNLVVLRRPPDFTDVDPEYLAAWRVDGDTVNGVQERLRMLANDVECKHKSIFGLVGLSAWYDFVGTSREARFDHANLIMRLARHLDWSLPPNIYSRILHALTVESAYWAPDVNREHRGEILDRLLKLLPTAPSGSRSSLACSLVVLTLGLNYGATYLRRAPISEYTDVEEGLTSNPASLVAKHYTTNPDQMREHKQQLSVLALTGLLEHFEHCNFDDISRNSIGIVARQLADLTILGKFQSITLPHQTSLNIDIRVYLAEVISLYLRHAQTSPHAETNEILVYLLEGIHKHRGFCADYGSLLALPILQTLQRTQNVDLWSLCLSITVQNLGLGSSLPYLKMLLAFDIPYRLVALIKNLTLSKPLLRVNASLVFQLIAEYMPSATHIESPSSLHTEVVNAALELLRRLLQDDLLGTFIQHILNPDVVPTRREFWEQHILKVIATPNLDAQQMNQCLAETLWYLRKLGFTWEQGTDSEQRQGYQGQEHFLDKLFKAIYSETRWEMSICKYGFNRWLSFWRENRGRSFGNENRERFPGKGHKLTAE